jgi:hypothetical protein
VLIRVGRETKDGAKQQKQNDVDVQGNLPGEKSQGRLDIGRLREPELAQQEFVSLNRQLNMYIAYYTQGYLRSAARA